MTFGPISVLPNGWPNLFGMTGQSIPKGFQEFIAPTMEMLQFFALANCRELVDSGAVAVAAPGSVNLFTVPAEEAWLCLGVGVSWNASAAQYVEGQLNIFRGDLNISGAVVRTLAEGRSNPAGAVIGPVVNVKFLAHQGDAFLLYGGDSVIFTCNGLIGGPLNVSARAAIFRFSI
uniref:Uncharacterized protein n=1 Tax=uncultured prokaryote TaxID=198431 RepID=A0A0H5Q372_9ZZZZ|nr:hypothetical protein [uncultured prokaryote]